MSSVFLPKIIEATRLVNVRLADYDLYIGENIEGSRFGLSKKGRDGAYANPHNFTYPGWKRGRPCYVCKVDHTKEEAFELFKPYFEEWIKDTAHQMSLKAFKGKRLGCWCKDLTYCHGQLYLSWLQRN